MENTNILIVDDSKTIAKGLQQYIEKIIPGVDCLVAYSKQEAKAILSKNKDISCALLDLHLPDAPNGEIVDFVSILEVPIVVLSGKIELAEKVDRTNVVDYVVKDGIYSFYYASNLVKQIIKNKNIQVLVVDDSRVALERTANHLRRYNLQVLTAVNGMEALKVIKENPCVKMVYTDYNMPLMDGLELTRELRKKYSKDKLSIIVVSTQSDSKTTSTLLKYGANDFLDKNYNSEEFYARLNTNLEILELFDEIETKNEQNRQKDKIIQEQNKMSAMADLIKNISHHWRQPLNAISTSADGLKLDYELDMLDLNDIPDKMTNIVESTQFLSKTIETFREIISESPEAKMLVIQDEIDKVIEVQKYSLEEKNIKLINEVDYSKPIKLDLPVGDLNKVLIYIINNANDALSKLDRGDKWIKVSLCFLDEGMFNICVEDNGGGIDKSIMDRIFEPYFTTKHQSPGTGLGLHMALNIVTQNLKGNIHAENTDCGAKFVIELPTYHEKRKTVS